MKVEVTGNIVIITPNKKIDGVEFINKILEALNEHTDKNFILDCKNIDYMGSSDVCIILDMHKRLLKRRSQLIVCNLHDAVKKLFCIVSLNKIISIYQDKEHAIAYLSTIS